MSSRAVLVALLVLSACNGADPDHSLIGDAAIDAPVDALVCPVTADEPATPQSAVVTGVASMHNSVSLTGLVLCPVGDTDTFQVEITTSGSTLEATIETAPNEPSVVGSLLNNNGTPIMNASPVGTNTRRILAPNLPTGIYFVQVFAMPAAISHYQLALTATAP